MMTQLVAEALNLADYLFFATLWVWCGENHVLPSCLS